MDFVFRILTHSSFSVVSAACSSSLWFAIASSEKTNSRMMYLESTIESQPSSMINEGEAYLLSRHFCTKSSCTRLNITAEKRLYSSSAAIRLVTSVSLGRGAGVGCAYSR